MNSDKATMKLLKKLTVNDVDVVLKTIYSSIDKAIFIYVDLLKYGVNHPNIDFYVYKKDTSVKAVMMKYFSGLQLFLAEIEDDIICDVKKYISQHEEIKQITGAESTLKALDMDESSYGYIQTYVVERFKFEYAAIERYEIKEAGIEDVDRISSFMLTDEYYKQRYTQEDFADEMRDRLTTNYGRCFYLEENGSIFAAIQTVANIGGISMSSLLLVDKEHRGEGLAESLVGYVTDVELNEGKRMFGIFSSHKGMKKYVDNGSAKYLSTSGKYYKK